jgi:hypothetical protein
MLNRGRIEMAELVTIAKLHKMGIDQTDTLTRFFGAELKIVELAKIDILKERVLNGAFYLSRKDKEWLVVDMFGGDVHKVDARKYLLIAEENNILVTDLDTDEEFYILSEGRLFWGNVKHLGPDNYTFQSSDKRRGFKGYPSLRFSNSYNKSLRIHWIIALMNYGIEAVEVCVGLFRTHEIHHKVPFGATANNSISNLVIMHKRLHEELHGYYRGA